MPVQPRLIVTDCSSMDRLGEIEKPLAGLPTAFIDHHRTNSAGGIRYINAEAPATASLVLTLWETLGEPLPREAAEYLLLSLCTDTGFFRHIDEGGAETLADAHKLVAAGGNLKKTFAEINGGRTLESRKLLGTVLNRAESCYDGRLLVTTEALEETERFGRENRDSDTLYQLLQAVQGVEAIAVIRQDTKDSCAVGLRSRDTVDVSAIAAELGGGGHKNASGAYIPGNIPEIKARVIALFASRI
jgi:phosphoesterase RecJ-like protein